MKAAILSGMNNSRGTVPSPPNKGGIKLKSLIYKLLRISNDINSVRKGTVGRRIGRRVYGKATGRLARKIFK